jgi:hypothetical protein
MKPLKMAVPASSQLVKVSVLRAFKMFALLLFSVEMNLRRVAELK